MFRMPMTVWAMFITAILQAFALPVLTSALIMQLLDRVAGTNFFSPVGWTVANAPPVVGGGGPLLFQHLFWFYSHPAVYVMILPAMGMVSDIIATFSRKPLFGYKPMVFAIAGIAGLGFIVWGHHMFQSGMNPALGATFMLSTMMIALPSAIKVFNWLGTMWGGRHPVHLGHAQRHGLRGDVHHRRPVGDLHGGDAGRHAHPRHLFHRRPSSTTCSSAAACSRIFGAIYYWFPKMFGRMMNERLGLIHFFLTFIFFNGTFFLMHIVGMHGHPRRIADPTIYRIPPAARASSGMNQFMTINAFLLGLTQTHLRLQLLLQPGRRAQGRGQSLARQHAGVGDDVAAGALQLRADSRRSTTLRTNTACRASRKTILPQTQPRPAIGRSARPGHGLTCGRATTLPLDSGRVLMKEQ